MRYNLKKMIERRYATMGYGTLAHMVGKWPLQQLVQKLGAYEIDFVQLALAKAIGDIDTGLGKLSPGLANHIGEQFDKQGIRIGVLGCYINPIHPDPVQRRYEIDRFKEHLRFARDFGTTIVATETGDWNTYQAQDSQRYREIGWSILKETVEELIEEAEKWGVYVGLEPVCVHTLSTTERMRHLLDEVHSNHIGVVLDPCNLLDHSNFERQDEVVDETFALFGDRIVLAHLKDVIYQPDGRLKETRLGLGTFHIAKFLQKLNQHKPHLDVSIEAVTENEINEAIQFAKQQVNESQPQ
jgi:sugar phosphate isomerase/epimerase